MADPWKNPWSLVAWWADERAIKLMADAKKAEKAYSPTSEFGHACRMYAAELRLAASALMGAADRFRERVPVRSTEQKP